MAAPQVSVSSRVVYILRQPHRGRRGPDGQLFSRRQSRSTNVATFLALLELVRGGRVTLGREGELTMQRGLTRKRRKNEPETDPCRRGGHAVCLRGAHRRRQAGAGRAAAPASVENALEELRTRYTREDSGLCLLHLNTRWQLATKTEWADCIRRLLDSRRAVPLGPAAMETLTVIAYNQPVSRAFIEQVRGVDSSSSVSGLLEKGLIEEAGRLDLPGRPGELPHHRHLFTVFGLSSLADLPPVHQPEAPAESEG